HPLEPVDERAECFVLACEAMEIAQIDREPEDAIHDRFNRGCILLRCAGAAGDNFDLGRFRGCNLSDGDRYRLITDDNYPAIGRAIEVIDGVVRTATNR